MINKKLISFALFFFATAATAQESEWDVTIPRGQTRTIEFTTTEGTFISVDISPDGAWVVFDLLGHVYRVLAAGGDAECLTCNSGIALNYNPRYAPDGTQIAFISDRKGQNNLWIMDADGENPRPVTEDLMVRAFDPEWTPDGRYLMVRRQEMAALGQPAGGSGIWLYHVDGGSGVEIVGSDVPGAGSPSASPDGRYVYFHGVRARDQRPPARSLPAPPAGPANRPYPRAHPRRGGRKLPRLFRRSLRARGVSRWPLPRLRTPRPGWPDCL